ncbi:MAG: glutaminyl-peptide cyclotransferase [Bacteroidales bacterium]|nr:glutaminyl-peptide cyclotransferase [Bacteroidales bacterium]
MKKYLIYIFAIVLLMVACKSNPGDPDNVEVIPTPPEIPIVDYRLIATYPHDTTSFTEGFLFYNGELFESTGATAGLNFTRSLFGIVNLSNGKIDVKAELDKNKYFGEGITILDGKVYQLTYISKTGFVYDLDTYKLIRTFEYANKEGWGLTNDGTNLIMSDGTFNLTFLNPNTFQVVKSLAVTENSYAVNHLNELEYINGYIYANVWMTNIIVKIDSKSGQVVGKLDLTDLANDSEAEHAFSLEMNGIAYDSLSNRILITGKLWPKIYEITFDY